MKIKNILFGALLAMSTSAMAQDAYSVSDVNINAGDQATFDIALSNQSTYTSATIDLQLPAGISIPQVLNEDDELVPAVDCPAKKSDHILTVGLIDAATNTYRFLIYSGSNKTFKAGDVLFAVTIAAAADVAGGEYAAKLIASGESDPVVTPDGTQSFLSDVDFKIIVAGGTGIKNLGTEDANAPVYNLSGQRMMKTSKGLYIKNGKKMILK